MSSKIPHIIPLIILFVLKYANLGIAGMQNDSLQTSMAPMDSLLIQAHADSQNVDSTESKAQLDAPIYYWADNGTVSRQDNKLYLSGNAKIVYQDLTLEAEKIMIDQDKN